MRLTQKLFRSLFDIREGEHLKVTLMTSYIFFVISSLMIVRPVCTSLFLSRFGAAGLPYAFVLVAGFATIVASVYAKLLRHLDLHILINRTLLLAVGCLAVFRVLLQLKFLEGPVLFVFYVWVAIFALISSSQFWILANSIFNAREAKRLFGFIGAGAIGGGIFGGYLTKFTAASIGSENLIFVSIAFMSICIFLSEIIWRNTSRDQKLQQFRKQHQSTASAESPLKLIRNSKHLIYLSTIIGIGVLAAKLVEYQFSAIASERITQEDQLTAFFGFWLSNLNVAALLTQLFVTPRVVGVFGVGTSLFFLPVGILLGAVAILVHPALWSAVLIKVGDGSLKNSINKAGIELLALPIPAGIKNQTKTFVDVSVDSTATGLGGLILIFVTAGLGFSVRQVSLLIILLIAGWLILVKKVRYEFVGAFRLKLADRDSVSIPTTAEVGKESVLTAVVRGFETQDEAQVLRVLRMTRQIHRPILAAPLGRLLHHSSDLVRLEALKQIYYYRKPDFSKEVQYLIREQDVSDLSNAIRTEAMHYLFAHGGKNRVSLLNAYLDDDNLAIACPALLCVARESRSNPDLKKAFKVRQRVETWLEKLHETDDLSSNDSARAMCARAIGAANIAALHPYLHIFLNDISPSVVKAALLGAGESREKSFLPRMLKLLGNEEFQDTCVEALASFGPQTIDVLAGYLGDAFIDRQIQLRIPRVIAEVGLQRSVDTLVGNLGQSDPRLRYSVIRALNYMRRHFPHLKFDDRRIVKQILDEARDYLNTLAALYRQMTPKAEPETHKEHEASEAIREARAELARTLEKQLDRNLERIFRLLGLKYSPEDIYNVYRGLHTDAPDFRANAVEFLDNVLDTSLKKVIIPIVETPLVGTLIGQTLEQLGLKGLSEFECLGVLLSGTNTIVQKQTLALVQHLKDERYAQVVGQLLDSSDPEVRLAAKKALNLLGFSRLI